MVLANTKGPDPYVAITAAVEDFELDPGMHVMFDCHGSVNLYCWDGGKTWVVGDEPSGTPAEIATATADAMTEIEQAMRPGARISELQAIGRNVYRRHGLSGADDVLIFFHGLGLSHLDQELGGAPAGSAAGDWALERNMVVASHLLYAGDERNRMWLEDIAVVGDSGGESIFTWGFEPHTGP